MQNAVETMRMPPEISRINAGIAFTGLAFMACGCVVPLIWQVVVPYACTGNPPADWTRPRVYATCLALLALFLYLGWVMFQRFATRLTEAGISAPSLRGGRRLRWEQIERMGLRGHELVFEGHSGRITVNLLCFRQPSEVEAYVRSHLPARVGGNARAA